ncbi:hypothetical protein ACGRL8_02185 [Vibrio rumoiensis]|uniref:DUF3149 domain-containing protein n=1 Tax=Vibrio rumoiensis TaxID=76258 RepID=A0ABW7ITM4_9VIBR|nr:hypothetical protein [Vibrio rumoiensis]
MIQINLSAGFVPLLIGLSFLFIGGGLMLYYAYRWDKRHLKKK